MLSQHFRGKYAVDAFFPVFVEIPEVSVEEFFEDALVFYNLACSYALLNQTRAALGALTKAIGLGYDDFEHLKGDTDLDNLLKDEHFQQYIKQLEKKKKIAKHR